MLKEPLLLSRRSVKKSDLTGSVADPGCLSRIRLFSIPDRGSDVFPSRIPDPNCLHPGSRILIKEFKYFYPQKSKKWFLSSKKYDPGCLSRIPDPGVKKAPNPGSGSATLVTGYRANCCHQTYLETISKSY